MRNLISVCIPAYNSGEYLEECIKSILAQSVEEIEIIISDNCSTDNTKELVESFDDSRIRYYAQSENIGSRRNLNFVIEQARGEFVKTFCADDIMLPDLLALQLEVLKARPYVSLVTCNYVGTDSRLKMEELHKTEFGIELGKRAVLKSVNRLENLIGGPSNLMWRKSDALAARYDSDLKYLSDFDFAAQILQNGFLENINCPGYLYRRHSNSDTELNCGGRVQVEEWGAMYLKWGGRNYYALKAILSGISDPLTKKKLRNSGKSSFSFKARIKREIAWFLCIRIFRGNWKKIFLP